jgi:hypothetical protein
MSKRLLFASFECSLGLDVFALKVGMSKWGNIVELDLFAGLGVRVELIVVIDLIVVIELDSLLWFFMLIVAIFTPADSADCGLLHCLS